MVYWYQRRTLTGTGETKTVRRSTGKTPRSIVAALATTSAMIMVRFFCISQLGYVVTNKV